MNVNKRIVLVLLVLESAFVAAATNEYYDIVIDKDQSLGEAVVWMRYGLERAVYRGKNNITSSTGVGEAIPTFSEELASRTALVKSLAKLRESPDDGTPLDRIMPYLEFLEKVYNADFMEEYVWMFHRRDGWVKPAALKFSEFGDWLGANSPAIVPRAGAILRISDKSKNDIVTESLYPADEDEEDGSNGGLITTADIAGYNVAAAAANKFVDSLNQGDSYTSSELFATYEKMPKEIMAQEVRKLGRIAQSCKRKEWHFSYVELGVAGNCAVAIVCEDVKRGKAAYDLDPLFMVRQEGDWKVVPGMSDLEYAEVLVSEDELEQLKQCQRWFEERKEELEGEKNNSN